MAKAGPLFSVALFAGRMDKDFDWRYFDGAVEWMRQAVAHKFQLVLYLDRAMLWRTKTTHRWVRAFDPCWVTVRLLRGTRAATSSDFVRHHDTFSKPRAEAARGEVYHGEAATYAKMGLRWQVLDDYPGRFVCVRDADSPIALFDLAMQRRLCKQQGVDYFSYKWRGAYPGRPSMSGVAAGGGSSIRTNRRVRARRRRQGGYLGGYLRHLETAWPRANSFAVRSVDEYYLFAKIGLPTHSVDTVMDFYTGTFALKDGTTVIPGPYDPVGDRATRLASVVRARQAPLKVYKPSHDSVISLVKLKTMVPGGGPG